jgi:hypothetical protein
LKIDQNLSEIFDIEESKVIDVPAVVKDTHHVDVPEEQTIDTDFEMTRKNLHLLLMQGEDALMGALEVAKASEHPRAFEVVGTLMKQLADVNQQLLDLHRQKAKLDEPVKGVGGGKQVTNNNAIFVGSTTELNKMISNMQKGA